MEDYLIGVQLDRYGLRNGTTQVGCNREWPKPGQRQHRHAHYNFGVSTHALAQPWLETMAVSASELEECRVQVNLRQIDRGEASAWVLSSQCTSEGDEVLVMVDETRGRMAAQHGRIALTGTAGLLLLAKNAGLLNAVTPLLLGLQAEGHFLSHSLMEAVARLAGEA